MLDVMFDLPDNRGSRYLIEAGHVDEANSQFFHHRRHVQKVPDRRT